MSTDDPTSKNSPSRDSDAPGAAPRDSDLSTPEPPLRDSDVPTPETAPRDSDASSPAAPRDSDAPSSDDRPSLPPALPPRFALPLALAVTVAVALVVRYAFDAERAGTWAMLLSLFAAYAPLAVLAVYVILKEGRAAAELRPRGGDLTLGALVAGLLFGAVMAGRQLVFGPDSPQNWWIARIYLQLGDLSNNRILYVGLAVLVIAVLEELVWRGLVMRSLRRPFGPVRAWVLSSALYAVAHVATITLLAHPVAGPNPLLVGAALVCGLVWGHLVNRTGRLVPSLFAHGLFSWAIVDFPLWRP